MLFRIMIKWRATHVTVQDHQTSVIFYIHVIYLVVVQLYVCVCV